jgi:hypothetical protein
MSLNLKSLTDRLQGKSTTFFVAFFVMGNLFHFIGKLDSTFITFMTALLGFVVGHSFKDDKHEQNMAVINGGNGKANSPDPPSASPPALT